MLRLTLTQPARWLSHCLTPAEGARRTTINLGKSVFKSRGYFCSQFHTQQVCQTTPYQVAWQRQGKHTLGSCQLHQKRTSPIRNTSTSHEEDLHEVKVPDFKPIYRLPSIVGLRILSRIKIAQTGLTLAIIPPLAHYHAVGVVTTWQLQFSISTASFALFMLYTMSFFLRRIIGAMYLHRNGDLLKVSHLTFWGSRTDDVFPVVDVVPLSEGSNKPDETLMKLERYSTKDVCYFTLRFGYITDLEQFENVFGNH